MNTTEKTSAILLAAVALTACRVLAGTLDFATRVSCELQTASGTSLQRVTWQQGTTPLLSVEQFRLGKAIAADTNTDAVVVIGPSATSQYYVAVTNQSTSGTSYLVQMPTVGTNTASGVWWYTVYFERNGRRYWTGNGALTIEATTSTGDGLVWQTITGVSVAALQSALDAEAQARAAGDAVAMTNWQAIVYSMTNGAALGATALQPSWAATGTVFRATEVVGAQSTLIAGAVQTEVDPIWVAVSDAVTNGAALGATALQPAATNGWTVGSHAGLATWQGTTNAAAAVWGTVAATGTVANAGTAGTADYATSAGTAAAVYRMADTVAGTNSWTVLANGTQQVYVVTYSQVVGVDTNVVRVAYADIRMEDPPEYSPAVGDIWPAAPMGYGREGWTLQSGSPAQWIVRDEHGDAGNVGAAPTNVVFEIPMSWEISFEFPMATNSVPATNIYPLARSADIAAHAGDPAAHADIRDQIDAIPLPPTNAVAGWLVWDSGSNCYWQVTATNLRFYVWGVEP